MKHTASRILRSVVVVTAGASVGLAATFAVATAGSGNQRPGSYQPAERSTIAEWAVEHHLSGLSPASLRKNAASGYEWTPRIAAQMKVIADDARDNGLTGLSPASLRPLDD